MLPIINSVHCLGVTTPIPMTSFISSAETAKILSKLFRVFGQYPLYLSRFIQSINKKQIVRPFALRRHCEALRGTKNLSHSGLRPSLHIALAMSYARNIDTYFK